MALARATPVEPPAITVEEFLRWQGGKAGVVYELVEGAIRAQDAASDTHGTVHTRLVTALTQHLDRVRPGCRVVTGAGVRPRLRGRWNYRVPELAVTCTPNRADVHEVPEPILIVEVLSPSNARDTWSNVALYASLPSVTEILVVHSTRIGAELLRRQSDGSWPTEPEPIAAGGRLELACIGLELPLGDVYRGTHLVA
jgi:Uma2 family endonuclease